MSEFPSKTSASGMWALKKQKRAVQGNRWPTPEKDPYFNSVALLLSDTGINGSSNTTFADSSDYKHTITRSGGVIQGSVSPFGADWSNYFDGSGDYLTVAANTNLDLTGDFTIEFYTYVDKVADNFIMSNGSQSGSACWYFRLNTSTGVATFAMAITTWAGLTLTSASNVVKPYTWVHVAATRSGSQFNLFINGVSVASATNSGSLINTGRILQIGYFDESTGTNFHTGYISNLRIVKGRSLYNSTFIPPTEILTAVTGTVLLTCQSNRFVDNSQNNFSFTIGGNVAVDRFSPLTTSKPYGTSTLSGSYYFDGNGDYLSIPYSISTNILSGNFTVECWIYHTSTSADTIVSSWGQSSSPLYDGWSLDVTATNGLGFSWQPHSTAAYFITTSDNILATNTWNHVAVTRSGNSFTIWLNGVSVGTGTNSGSGTAIYKIDVGFYGNGSLGASPTSYFNGYISNLRIIKGTALYTTNFTPSILPLNTIENTSLLLNGTAAGIYDSTTINNIDVIGNTQVSTSQSAWSKSSIYFDGNGDYLKIPNNPLFAVGSVFTIECWFYPNAQGGNLVMGTVGTAAPQIGWQNTTTFGFASVSTAWRVTSTTLPRLNSWNHVAVSRTGTGTNQTYLFLNGVLIATGTSADAFTTATGFTIGAASDNTTPFNGYIEDVRITKGVARYTSNFSPLLPKIENTSGTQLLLTAPSSANWLKDSSTNNFTVTSSGNAAYSNFRPPTKTDGGSFYFDGTGDYLTVPANSALELGTGDFTIEAWVYVLQNQNYNPIFLSSTSGAGDSLHIQLESLGKLRITNVSTVFLLSSNTINTNQWNHIAVVKYNGVIYSFINGVSGGSVNNSTNFIQNGALIGYEPVGGATYFNGYITNLRVVKGTALYTADFNKPIITSLPRQ